MEGAQNTFDAVARMENVFSLGPRPNPGRRSPGWFWFWEDLEKKKKKKKKENVTIRRPRFTILFTGAVEFLPVARA